MRIKYLHNSIYIDCYSLFYHFKYNRYLSIIVLYILYIWHLMNHFKNFYDISYNNSNIKSGNLILLKYSLNFIKLYTIKYT